MKSDIPERSPAECLKLPLEMDYVEPGRAEHAATGANQFGLRGMFILTTVLCLTLGAVAAIGIRQPMHVLGAVIIAAFCAGMIGVIEVSRRLFGAQSAPGFQHTKDEPPFTLMESPFAESPSPFAVTSDERLHREN